MDTAMMMDSRRFTDFAATGCGYPNRRWSQKDNQRAPSTGGAEAGKHHYNGKQSEQDKQHAPQNLPTLRLATLSWMTPLFWENVATGSSRI